MCVLKARKLIQQKELPASTKNRELPRNEVNVVRENINRAFYNTKMYKKVIEKEERVLGSKLVRF